MQSRVRSLVTISVIGLGQIFAWGSSFYLIAILGGPVARETGWSTTAIVAGHSLALFAAGLVSPRVGRLLEDWGGRRVLALGSVLFAGGHLALALSHDIASWWGGWLLLGLGMACGLYDAAFATLGRIYGAKARSAITNVTLFGGLASTICWPLGAWLIEIMGWRGACLVFAAFQAFVMFPMHLLAVFQGEPVAARSSADARGGSDPRLSGLHWLLGAILTLAAAIAAIMSVHLIALLQARGLALSVAVAMGAMFGPAQVLARIVELAAGRLYHPLWTLAASVGLVCAGMILLGAEGPLALVAASLVLYGAGNGLNSIARGTTPLALFGPDGYARLMGRLALPALIAQALAPPLAAILLEGGGAPFVIAALIALALVNALLVAALMRATRGQRG